MKEFAQWMELHIWNVFSGLICGLFAYLMPVRNIIILMLAFIIFDLITGIIAARKRGEAKIDKVTLNHEAIHTAQMKELLYVFFYILYLIGWFIGLVVYGFDTKRAYREICFEKEAYENQGDLGYMEKRNLFNFLKYIK